MPEITRKVTKTATVKVGDKNGIHGYVVFQDGGFHRAGIYFSTTQKIFIRDKEDLQAYYEVIKAMAVEAGVA